MIEPSEKVALFQRDLFIVQEPNFLDYVLNKYFLAFFCQSNLPNPLKYTGDELPFYP